MASGGKFLPSAMEDARPEGPEPLLRCGMRALGLRGTRQRAHVIHAVSGGSPPTRVPVSSDSQRGVGGGRPWSCDPRPSYPNPFYRARPDRMALHEIPYQTCDRGSNHLPSGFITGVITDSKGTDYSFADALIAACGCSNLRCSKCFMQNSVVSPVNPTSYM